MPKSIAYIRTSSVDQNLHRQRDEMLKLGIEENTYMKINNLERISNVLVININI
jgi:hypothetical protein